MGEAYCYRCLGVLWSVFVLLVTSVSPAKPTEPIEMSLGMDVHSRGPKKTCIRLGSKSIHAHAKMGNLEGKAFPLN